MRRDDPGHHQELDGPHAEHGLHGNEEQRGPRQRQGPAAIFPEPESPDGQDHHQNPESAGQIAMAHLLPGLAGIKRRIGAAIRQHGRLHHQLAVAARPVGATQSGAGDAHIGPHDHDTDRQQEGEKG